MRCLKCRGKAIIELPRHHAAYCSQDFQAYFEEQVRRNIKRHAMFTPEDRILLAVSGGKDSLALWNVLLKMCYQATGLYIHLGIGDYSNRSNEAARTFARDRGSELLEVNLARDYGMGVPGLSRALRRPPCSGCGLTRRYIFNKEAIDRGFDVVATGHNMDDEAATLLGNTLHWQMEYMARQFPVLESNHTTLARKVKPLYTLTEKETAVYCITNGIDYVEEECPNAVGAKSLLYKEALNRIEAESPGAKQSFLRGFLEKARPLLGDARSAELRQCMFCGQPTTAETCAFCRMWDTAARRAREKNAVG